MERDEQWFGIVRAEVLELLVSKICRPRWNAVVSNAYWVFFETFILGPTILGYDSLFRRRRSGNKVLWVSFRSMQFGGGH